MRCTLLTAAVLLACAAAPAEEGQTKDSAAEPTVQARQAELEKQFAETLSGAELVGKFTDSAAKDAGLREERYSIKGARKLRDNIWLITARIKYGDHDVTVPLPLPVEWAGDTPVISLTDMKIPGLGTYSARVVIYRGSYAGTWSGGTHGGHLFGRIERTKGADAKDEGN